MASLAVLVAVSAAAGGSAASRESGAADVLEQANITRIDGARVGDRAGSSVAGVGDVNGDGLVDLFVGAEGADENGRTDSGSVYVVFGERSATTIDLAALGARGFRIDGAAADDGAGSSVAAVGDVNGDGRADLLVGVEGADSNGRTDSGSAYLVFGKTDTAGVDLAALGGRGFRIDGAAAGDRAGFSVAGVGDVNGDGRADVLVGVEGADSNGRTDSGSAYVVFGKTERAGVDLAALGGRGFRIDGAAADDRAGFSVAGAGDVNGDGRVDVLVGAFSAGHIDRDDSGSAYLVFGTTDRAGVDLAALGARGFRIDGGTASSIRRSARTGLPGAAVAGVGDVNGDGRADMLLGALFASNSAHSSGSAYLIFGKTDTAGVDLVALGARGFRIDGAADANFAGKSVAGAGDVNGDGRADVLVGAPGADNNGRNDSGSTYLVFGKTDTVSVELRAPVDTTPPKLVLSGRKSQRVLSQKGIVVTASCSEACTLRASATVVVGQATSLLMTPAFSTLDAPGRRTLKLTLSATALAQLERALRPGNRGTAKVTVRAVDRAGNAKSATRAFRLIR